LPTDAVYFGEISLSGAVRPVAQTSARLKEAAKLGFGRAILPESARGDAGGDAGLMLNTVGGLTSLVADIAARGSPRGKAANRQGNQGGNQSGTQGGTQAGNEGADRETAVEKNATPARFRRENG
jgi:DNA repair protein RadA/Sms